MRKKKVPSSEKRTKRGCPANEEMKLLCAFSLSVQLRLDGNGNGYREGSIGREKKDWFAFHKQ